MKLPNNKFKHAIAKGETQYFRVGYHTDPARSIPILGLFMRDESRFLFIEPYEKGNE